MPGTNFHTRKGVVKFVLLDVLLLVPGTNFRTREGVVKFVLLGATLGAFFYARKGFRYYQLFLVPGTNFRTRESIENRFVE